eukprot:CAMPEP_0118998206 /NCGR_PEP_ID=MMETSP1173-20130426/62950_1 /TAXON_ID=1034831 /ORGANISM="Rhizochromulina marina cf, Strain CCMP1243" /LENGTH=311 /DNA_ID=CAMNT_0006949687 /DNA_START=1 /DNA_END=940 /DNA_ORIENTATION=+
MECQPGQPCGKNGGNEGTCSPPRSLLGSPSSCRAQGLLVLVTSGSFTTGPRPPYIHGCSRQGERGEAKDSRFQTPDVAFLSAGRAAWQYAVFALNHGSTQAIADQGQDTVKPPSAVVLARKLADTVCDDLLDLDLALLSAGRAAWQYAVFALNHGSTQAIADQGQDTVKPPSAVVLARKLADTVCDDLLDLDLGTGWRNREVQATSAGLALQGWLVAASSTPKCWTVAVAQCADAFSASPYRRVFEDGDGEGQPRPTFLPAFYSHRYNAPPLNLLVQGMGRKDNDNPGRWLLQAHHHHRHHHHHHHHQCGK